MHAAFCPSVLVNDDRLYATDSPFDPASAIRLLLIVLLLMLAGCASREEEPEQDPIVVSAATWEMVDWDIINASTSAKDLAGKQARADMDYWRQRIYEQTEATFIPWYTGYWTQQWLSTKVAWYNVREVGETTPIVNRLTAYLEEQYQDQVLTPVAKEISPEKIRRQATRLYVDGLKQGLDSIPQRREVPQDQFDQRLKTIPAIQLPPPAKKQASVYKLIHARRFDKMPAYTALSKQIKEQSEQAALASSAGISGLARSTSERLESQLVARGAASTISTVVGKMASMILSVSATTYGIVAHQFDKPEMEAQLRLTINQAFDEDWQELMNNPQTGVLAEVNVLSETIEGNRLTAVSMPLDIEPITPGEAIPQAPDLQIEIEEQKSVDFLDEYTHE